VRDHAHGVEQLAAEELHAHDARGRIGVQVFLQEQKIVGQPMFRPLLQQRFQVRAALDEHDARAASALLRLEQHRKGDLPRTRADRLDVVERPRARRRNAELAQQRGLRRLADLERKRVGAVQHADAAHLERAHVRERVRHGARIAAHVCRRLAWLKKRRDGLVGVGERGPLQVHGRIADATALQRAEERLLPLGVLVEHCKIGAIGHAFIFWAKVAAPKEQKGMTL
jgi:hypothetical protein